MNNTDKEYFRLMETVIKNGRVKKNRTGIDTIGVFGEQAKFDINLNAFPVLTTKKIFWRGIVHELLWFLSGSTNIKYLVDNDVHIWDEWAYAKYKKSFLNLKPDLEPDAQPISQNEFINEIKTNAEFAIQWGELGEGTYGGMWRSFPYLHKETITFNTFPDTIFANEGHVDQIQKVIDKLKSNPDDRRLIVSAWHPYWVDNCALPPCHCLFQFHTEELTNEERDNLATIDQKSVAVELALDAHDKEGTYFNKLTKLGIPTRRLNCQLYQRSCDLFLGVPFNISSYCLLTAMMAHVTNMACGTFTHTYGDLHIYENHKDQCNLQLSREPMDLPKLWINPDKKNLFDIKYEDIKLIDYKSHASIKGEVAV